MKCPTCVKAARVIDSRSSADGEQQRRRYECSSRHRFTTIEHLETIKPTQTVQLKRLLMDALELL